MTISKGDYIRVPAGTMVWDTGWVICPERGKKSTREVVVEVREITDYKTLPQGNQEYWYNFLDRDVIERLRYNWRGPYGSAEQQAEHHSDIAKAKADIDAIFGDYVFVTWSGKTTLLANVEKAEAPERKKAAGVKTPGKRSLMVKGSVWRVTQDCTIQGMMYQPNHTAALVPMADLKAGTEVTVTGKFKMSYIRDESHGVPLKMKTGENVFHHPFNHPFHDPQAGQAVTKGDTTEIILPFKAVEDLLEPVGEAKEQYIYVLRDRATGLYYKTVNYNYYTYRPNPEWQNWHEKMNRLNPRPQFDSVRGSQFNQVLQNAYRQRLEEWQVANPPPSAGEYEATGDNLFEMEAKVTRAKQMPDMGKVKVAILNFTGYFNGLEADPNMPEWMQEGMGGEEDDGRSYPLPETFEAVKIGKFTKEEIEVIDIQEWYARALRLRVLTKSFGSSVRDLFNKTEKAGALEDWPYVISFRTQSEDGIQPKEIKEIDEAIEQMSMNGVVKKAKDGFSVSVMCPSFTQAAALRMAVDGMKVGIFETKTMTEMVEEPQ